MRCPRPLPLAALLLVPALNAGTSRIVEVGTPTELIRAIAPQTTILLRPGAYDLSTVDRTRVKSRWARLEEVHDGQELVLDKVADLRIEGAGPKRVRVITPSRYATVLRIENSARVELANLEFGHHPDPGWCAGKVVRVYRSSEVVFENCDFYGSGTIGLEVDRSRTVLVDGGVIRECSDLLVRAVYSKRLEFTRVKFHDTERRLLDRAFHWHEAWGVLFDDVQVTSVFPQRQSVADALTQGLPPKAIRVKAPPRPKRRRGGRGGAVRVRNTGELVAALASGRVLELEPGEYEVPRSIGLVGRKLKKVTLRGVGSPKPVLYSIRPQAWVLRFEDVADLTLENLALEHRVRSGHREEGALKIERGKAVTLRDVEVRGGGTIGMELMRIQKLRARGLKIRDCSLAIVHLDKVTDALIEDSAFELREQDEDGNPMDEANFSQYDCEDVRWKACTLRPAAPSKFTVQDWMVGDAPGVSLEGCRLLPPVGTRTPSR